MPPEFNETAIVLLAAGASERLGQPKQLLRFGHQTLLGKMAEVALSAHLGPVVAVLGAFYEKTVAALHGPGVEMVKNEDWATGMGGSIACGVCHVQAQHPAAARVLILLCDQPFVTPELLTRLVEKQQSSGALIVASSYGGTVGPPALFNQQLFGELAALHGKQGAKVVIRNHLDSLAEVPFPDGAVDIDTMEDWERWTE